VGTAVGIVIENDVDDRFPQEGLHSLSSKKKAHIVRAGSNICKQSNKSKHKSRNVPTDEFQLARSVEPKEKQ
jgi:hypothetical protein